MSRLHQPHQTHRGACIFTHPRLRAHHRYQTAMRRSTLGPVSQNSINMRSSIGGAPARLPRSSLAFKSTDDRRQSAFPSLGGRRSTAPRSSAYNSRGLRQDPRPLTDRQYIAATIRKLIAFLIERGYDQPLSIKILSNPSSRDFQNIFLFLLHRIDPTFEFSMRRDRKQRLHAKFEDELPALVRYLGYPFSVSKSVLSAVGSPHAWPQLLGILSWLMGLLQYDENCQTRKASDVALEPSARRANLFITNTIDAYAQFLQGADMHPELDKALESHFSSENANRAEEIDKLESDRDQLAKTLQGFRTHPSPLQLINEHRTSLETNIRKFKLLIPSLLEHAASVKKKLVEKEGEIDRDERSLHEILKDKERLVDILARQEEAEIDAERIAAEREQLRESLHKSGEERIVAETEQKHVEQRVAQVTEALGDELKVYHRQVGKLGLANLGDGQVGTRRRSMASSDCAIVQSTDESLTDPQEILSKDVEKTLLPRIHSLKESLSKKIPEKQEEALKLQEQIDEVEEQLIMLRHDLSIVEARKNKLDGEYKGKKEGLTRELQQRSESIMKKEEDISKSRERMRLALREKDRQIAALEEQRNGFKEEFARESQRIANLIAKNADVFQAHQTQVRRCVEMVRDHFEDESNRLGTEDS